MARGVGHVVGAVLEGLIVGIGVNAKPTEISLCVEAKPSCPCPLQISPTAEGGAPTKRTIA